MEEHRITIKIADRVYPQTVSEDNEAAIREAAKNVDGLIREFLRSYPGVSQVDIATIAALNAAIESVELKEKLEKMEKQIERISAGLQQYADTLK